MNYRHIQIGWAIIIPTIFVLCAAAVTGALFSEGQRVLPWIAGMVFVVISLFATLTVTVADGWLECRSGVGLIRRRIRLSNVRRAETVRNRWWYGWGIRLTPHGWLWNASGLDAVELTLANGKRFRVGTDEPGELLKSIHASTKNAGSSK